MQVFEYRRENRINCRTETRTGTNVLTVERFEKRISHTYIKAAGSEMSRHSLNRLLYLKDILVEHKERPNIYKLSLLLCLEHLSKRKIRKFPLKPYFEYLKLPLYLKQIIMIHATYRAGGS